ncbi:MAG: type IV pilus modification PilV family protein [Bacillota bacterium]|jgi:type II secretory pathway pseudopilin PulG
MDDQRGSIMLETVICLALVSFLFVMVVGHLLLMARVSRQEDARVQGLMAARVKVEELRSGWPNEVFAGGPNPYEDTFSLADCFEDFNMLGNGRFIIEREEDGLYKVVIWIYDKKGSEVYSTQTTVWLQP